MVKTASILETLPDITSAALTGLDQYVLDFLEGGAGEEWTLHRNRQAFSEWAFSPHLLSGHQRPDLSTSFLGVPLRMPVLTGPFGADALFHPDGQKAVARANAQAGVSGMAPEAASYSYSDVRREAPAGMAFGQLHPTGSEDAFLRRLGEFEQAGFQGLVVTCDCPTGGWRERTVATATPLRTRQSLATFPRAPAPVTRSPTSSAESDQCGAGTSSAAS